MTLDAAAASCRIKPRCVNQLMAGTQLTGLLFGLVLKENEFKIDPMFFPCCEGQGNYYDEERRASIRCQLAFRLRAVNRIYARYRELNKACFKDTDVVKLNSRPYHPTLLQMQKWLKGSVRGAVIPLVDHLPINLVWACAFALTWRFGYAAKVIKLGACLPNDFLWNDAVDGIGAGSAIFLCGLEKLSDPKCAQEFESLVSLAYHGDIRLFVETARLPKPAVVAPQQGALSFSTKGLLKKRVTELKKKNPVKFLQPDCVSRLDSILGEDMNRYFGSMLETL